MPISSFPQEQSLFERLGTGFGGGLSQQLGSGLQALGQAKLNQMLQRQQATQMAPGLQALLPSYSPEQIQSLAGFDPSVLKEVIRGGVPTAVGSQGSMALLEKQQPTIMARNEPFLKKHREDVELQGTISSLTSEIRDLLKSGKISEGFTQSVRGKLPQSLATAVLSDEEQQYLAATNSLVEALSQAGKGRGTKLQIELARSAKPFLGMSLKAQHAILDRLDKKVGKIKDRDQTIGNIIEQHGGYQPPNLESLVEKQLKSGANTAEEIRQPIERQTIPSLEQQSTTPSQKIQIEPQQVTGQQGESGIQSLLRNLAGTGTSAVSTISGLPADIYGGVAGLINKGASSVGIPGQIMPEEADVSSLFPVAKYALKGARYGLGKITGKEIPEIESLKVPGSQKIKEAFDIGAEKLGLGKNYLKAQSKPAQYARDLTDTVASLMVPLGPLGKGLSFGKALGLATAGALGDAGSDLLKLGPTSKGAVRFGSMVLASTLGTKKNLKQVNRDLWNKTDEVASDLSKEGIRIKGTEQLTKDLSDAFSHVHRGLQTPAKKEIREAVEPILKKYLNRGKTLLPDEAVQVVKDINNIIYNGVERTTQPFLLKVKSSLKDSINNMSKEYPEFVRDYKIANELSTGLSYKGFIGKFLDEHKNLGILSSKGFLTGTTGSLLKMLGFSASKAIGVPAAILSANEISKAIKMIQIPPIRNAYKDVMQASIRENTREVLRAINKLNNEVKKIRELHKNGDSNKELASFFKVSAPAMSKILRNETYINI